MSVGSQEGTRPRASTSSLTESPTEDRPFVFQDKPRSLIWDGSKIEGPPATWTPTSFAVRS